MLNDLYPSNLSVTSRNMLVSAIRDLRDNGWTWRRIGEHYGITGAMAYRIANNDYIPASPQIRQRLGLTPCAWFDLPVAVVRWALDHRVEIKETTHA